MTIRALTRADDAAIADLQARAADYIRLEWRREPDATSLAEFWNAAPPGRTGADGIRLGWFDGDRLDGIVDMAFGWPDPGDAYVGLMLLAPAARGQGIGPQMLARLTRIARARGATRQLVATLDANPRGRAFWARQGFRPLISIPGADGHTRLRMGRPL